MCRDSWPESDYLSNEELQAANAQVEDELHSELQGIASLASEKVNRQLAESDKLRMLAEKEEMQKQIELEQLSQTALNSAYQQYKADMKTFIADCKDLAALASKHLVGHLLWCRKWHAAFVAGLGQQLARLLMT